MAKITLDNEIANKMQFLSTMHYCLLLQKKRTKLISYLQRQRRNIANLDRNSWEATLSIKAEIKLIDIELKIRKYPSAENRLECIDYVEIQWKKATL